MKIHRRYTRADQSVFDTVEWTTRSSRITNMDGSVVFEMNDAEVPAQWSQLATDIMVSKYFRKAGVPQRDANGHVKTDAKGRAETGPERSVRQVVHRLAGCWRAWGERYGYFDTADDAQAFYDEVAYMMLHQMAAPNSPQWFNTGLNWAYGLSGPAQGHYHVDPETEEVKASEDAYTHPQPHACFIQSVEDDLVNEGGIMDLWVREARLFKYGSGTGTNFSKLRAENEPLSGGGRSSGLMSWLKIGDRAAGAIKSGGTTRRAAKMVCLDLDHPDVAPFVDWKVREELKVAALAEGIKHLPTQQQETARALGLELNLDFNGEAYQTVSGQNSNNSVRVPNRFFESLDADADWVMTRRTDGAEEKRMRAADLWDKIAFAAWRSADPGLQFDDTINEWHTCPNDGRINASNPCVTGDTLVATAEGYRRIRELVGRTVEIIDGGGEKTFVDRVFKTGHKPIYELKTKSGYRLRLTGDHPVYTRNRGDVPACELTVDDVVQLRGAGFGDAFVPEAFGELLGASLGDGCLTQGRDQEFLFTSLGESERVLAERLAGNVQECKQWLNEGDQRGLRPTQVTTTATGLRVGTSVGSVLERMRRYAVLDAGSESKRLTDEAFALDQRSQASLLRGLFTADGTVADYGEKSQYVSLDSTSRELLLQVQTLLLSFGIKAKLYENRRAAGRIDAELPDGKGGTRTYPVHQMHSLRISRRSRLTFEREIGFIEGTRKAEQLAALNQRVEAYRDEPIDRVASLTPCGEEDVYDLTEPRTDHFVANGIVVHNCSEYMFLDNTACNLASLNVLGFYDAESGRFDVDGYEHASRLWTIVLEISVLMAQYPSREIAELSHRFRTLGLGYANLGALLMQAGIPYDSERGRTIAGCLSAILTGRAYAASAELAAELGPFPGYADNRAETLRVIRNHRRAAHGVGRDPDEGERHSLGAYEGLSVPPVPIAAEALASGDDAFGNVADAGALADRAASAWDDALRWGERHGFRNAQVSVIAPTGTIGLLMDCDTTGVEPDFALVKFKKLAGGGYFKIANQSVERALRTLGYDDAQAEAIMRYVLGELSLDVPVPGDEDGRTVAGYLEAAGLPREAIQRAADTLPRVFELGQAFAPAILGEESAQALGIEDPSRADGYDVLHAAGLGGERIRELNRTICGAQTVEGAPHLEPRHLPVFDCANTCGPEGERFIAPEGHIGMMAAAQPFISGAISKTINLPHEATVEDIKAVYRRSWELGLKANALYRDGSKLSQVLSSQSSEEADEKLAEPPEDEDAEEEARGEVSAEVAAMANEVVAAVERTQPGDPERVRRPVEKVVEKIVERPLRRRLPETRRSVTHKFNVAGHEGYLTVGLYEDGSPGELFVTMAKEGSTVGGLMDSLGTAISVALQYGVPVESLVKKFTHQRFEPAGMTTNPEVPFAQSLVDYIFRWMGMEFVPGYRAQHAPQSPGASERGSGSAAPERKSESSDHGPNGGGPAGPTNGHGNGHGPARGGEHAASEARGPRHGGNAARASDRFGEGATHGALAQALAHSQGDAPACDVCGTITVRNGTCYKCLNCGNSMGCS